jgi:predicted ATP-binding protein involved in virulence
LVPGATPLDFEFRADQVAFRQWAQQFTARSGWIHPMGPDRYYDSRTETQYSATDLWRVFGVTDTAERMPLAVSPSQEFRERIATVKTHLVEAQRLMRISTNPQRNRRNEMPIMSPAVLADAQEIGQRLSDAFTQYGRISQKLDQTFPQRLFDWPQSMTREQIKKILGEIEDEQARLSKLGVLDTQPSYPFSLSILDKSDTAKLDAMELYVTDGKEKLKPLVEFASRIEPLLSNINAKFKNKIIRLDRERGLVARAADGADIKADQLSSGEQHEIVLLFHLLFRVSKNTLVLIDEPELSLHIDWQRRFLPELLAIAGHAQIDALVATHSPYIAGEREDLMIDLESQQPGQ